MQYKLTKVIQLYSTVTVPTSYPYSLWSMLLELPHAYLDKANKIVVCRYKYI